MNEQKKEKYYFVNEYAYLHNTHFLKKSHNKRKKKEVIMDVVERLNKESHPKATQKKTDDYNVYHFRTDDSNIIINTYVSDQYIPILDDLYQNYKSKASKIIDGIVISSLALVAVLTNKDQKTVKKGKTI